MLIKKHQCGWDSALVNRHLVNSGLYQFTNYRFDNCWKNTDLTIKKKMLCVTFKSVKVSSIRFPSDCVPNIKTGLQSASLQRDWMHDGSSARAVSLTSLKRDSGIAERSTGPRSATFTNRASSTVIAHRTWTHLWERQTQRETGVSVSIQTKYYTRFKWIQW